MQISQFARPSKLPILDIFENWPSQDLLRLGLHISIFGLSLQIFFKLANSEQFGARSSKNQVIAHENMFWQFFEIFDLGPFFDLFS